MDEPEYGISADFPIKLSEKFTILLTFGWHKLFQIISRALLKLSVLSFVTESRKKST